MKTNVSDILGFNPCYPVDCDDMLAWLTGAADKNVSTDTRRQSKWGGCQLVTVTINRGMIDQQFTARTLHAALEAAVRAVHDAEEASK